jgi:putative ATP-dependent endonuclease of the OLD family
MIEPKNSEINDAINEGVESLKQFVVNKHISKNIYKPIYPSQNLNYMVDETTLSKDIKGEMEKMKIELNSLIENLNKCIQKKKDYVESNWESQKIDMVPGDLLLDLVCKKFGLRFRKTQDSRILASLMNETEIESDFKDVISQIKN